MQPATPNVQLPTRREFLNQAALLLGIAATGAAVTLVPACTPITNGNAAGEKTVDIASETKLQSVGGAIIKTIDGTQVVIIRSSTSAFLVLSAICTHSACVVELPSGGSIDCKCHNSRFSATDGSVQRGPAATPLRSYTSVFNSMSNILTITF
jgi:cytochrome b6-f complex iron-sulfur subunit